MRSRFFGRLFASYAVLVVANALLVEFLISRWADRDARAEIAEMLEAQAHLLGEAVAPLGGSDEGGEARLQRRVQELGATTGSRLTVMAPDGRVLADSAERPEAMKNHLDRPEFIQAAAHGRGSAERVSDTTGESTLYVAVAVAGPGGAADSKVGYVRAAWPLPRVAARVGRQHRTALAGVAVGATLALALAIFVARRITKPLTQMRRAAVALAEGDPAAVVRYGGSDELGELARAFNRMAVRLRDRVDELDGERGKLTTVLESMAEGVVAVDAEERLIHCNAAARSMLGIVDAPVANEIGRPLVELVRTPELIEALRRARAHHGSPLIEEVRVHASGRERVVSIHAAPLDDRGAVSVLLDVTELRRLETVRRDFVANVSHEIKTPLAAMRGLVETLVEDESMDPGVRRRFLGKLGDHVHRLTDLATDLLHLSRAESETPPKRVQLDLGAAAAAACERFAAAAAAKQITLECEAAPVPVPAPVIVPCDPEAVVQILDNLIDNAIKYTPAGGRVTVRVGISAESGSRARVEVADSGVGIEPSERERVFERFYRVDKARSRDVPGTGLGLSIVKHLVEGHGGVVELESWPGRGSTFRVLLPRTTVAAARADVDGKGSTARVS